MVKMRNVFLLLLFVAFNSIFVLEVKAQAKLTNEITQQDREELTYWKKRYPIDWYDSVIAHRAWRNKACVSLHGAAGHTDCYPVRLLFQLPAGRIKSIYLHFDDKYKAGNIIDFPNIMRALLNVSSYSLMTFNEYYGYDLSYNQEQRLSMDKIHKWIRKGLILKEYRNIAKERLETLADIFNYEVEIKDKKSDMSKKND